MTEPGDEGNAASAEKDALHASDAGFFGSGKASKEICTRAYNQYVTGHIDDAGAASAKKDALHASDAGFFGSGKAPRRAGEGVQ
ncbi:MAG: hypothetical protein LBH09_03805 [Peptococcaceae bacterium]|jgi:hypothetical protein|nr:hypothetical protein [Peptococcaceae bacterium]